jgi:lysozyme family protein
LRKIKEVRDMQTIRQFIEGFIRQHEGGLSLHPADNGNWFDPSRFAGGLPQKRNLGVLVGSKYGVTAYPLALHRKIKNVTRQMMADLTLAEAVDIGVSIYYDKPGFSRLPWDRVTASIVDKGWGSGPSQSIKLMQRMIGVAADGIIGPATVRAYNAWRASLTEEKAAEHWAAVRRRFDLSLTTNNGPNDPDKKFIRGWNNRTDSFLPGTAWWKANA